MWYNNQEKKGGIALAVLIAVSTAYNTDTAQLSAARREKAARYRSAQERKRCLCAGVALDEALKTVGLREQAVIIAYNEHGKPYFPEHPQLHFSLSHSGDYAVCVLTDAAVGVDVEQVRPFEWERAAKRAFTEAQRVWLTEQPREQQAEAFFGLWTEVESRLKQSGAGLSGLSAVLQDIPCRSYSFAGYRLAVCTDGSFPERITFIE